MKVCSRSLDTDDDMSQFVPKLVAALRGDEEDEEDVVARDAKRKRSRRRIEDEQRDTESGVFAFLEGVRSRNITTDEFEAFEDSWLEFAVTKTDAFEAIADFVVAFDRDFSRRAAAWELLVRMVEHDPTHTFEVLEENRDLFEGLNSHIGSPKFAAYLARVYEVAFDRDVLHFVRVLLAKYKILPKIVVVLDRWTREGAEKLFRGDQVRDAMFRYQSILVQSAKKFSSGSLETSGALPESTRKLIERLCARKPLHFVKLKEVSYHLNERTEKLRVESPDVVFTDESEDDAATATDDGESLGGGVDDLAHAFLSEKRAEDALEKLVVGDVVDRDVVDDLVGFTYHNWYAFADALLDYIFVHKSRYPKAWTLLLSMFASHAERMFVFVDEHQRGFDVLLDERNDEKDIVHVLTHVVGYLKGVENPRKILDRLPLLEFLQERMSFVLGEEEFTDAYLRIEEAQKREVFDTYSVIIGNLKDTFYPDDSYEFEVFQMRDQAETIFGESFQQDTPPGTPPPTTTQDDEDRDPEEVLQDLKDHPGDEDFAAKTYDSDIDALAWAIENVSAEGHEVTDPVKFTAEVLAATEALGILAEYKVLCQKMMSYVYEAVSTEDGGEYELFDALFNALEKEKDRDKTVPYLKVFAQMAKHFPDETVGKLDNLAKGVDVVLNEKNDHVLVARVTRELFVRGSARTRETLLKSETNKGYAILRFVVDALEASRRGKVKTPYKQLPRVAQELYVETYHAIVSSYTKEKLDELHPGFPNQYSRRIKQLVRSRIVSEGLDHRKLVDLTEDDD